MSIILSNEQLRLARMEAICNHQRAEMKDVIEQAYANAVEEHNEKNAALLARKIRNKLLDESDKEMTFDRLNLDTASVTTFLTSLTQIMNNAWAKYRQHLRDISKQQGFPFEIDWGTRPDESEVTNNAD